MNGIQLKVGRNIGGIRLICNSPQNIHNSPVKIQSEEGRSQGSLGAEIFCPENLFGSGFQIRYQYPQAGTDGTTFNNLRLICSRENGEEKTIIEGDGLNSGVWTSTRECSPGQYIYGFQQQHEFVSG